MKRNREIFGTSLLKGVFERVEASLPPGWSVELRSEQLASVVELKGPDTSHGRWGIRLAEHLDPKGVFGILRQINSSGGLPLLVVAPFLSEETRRRLREAGASYADATGNMRLVLDRPAVFIETRGEEKNPWAEARPLISLRGQGAGRVVRAVCDFNPPLGIRELAQRAGLPLGTTARVVELLDREALIERNAKGQLVNSDWEGIIRRWSRDYDLLKANKHALFLEPRGLPALLEKLKGSDLPYCVTGSLAAVRHAPIASPRLAIVYAEDAMALAASLNIKRVESTGNVILVESKAAAPFERTCREDGVAYAGPSQIAVDLMNSPGRGPAEAEALLEWMKEHPDAWRT